MNIEPEITEAASARNLDAMETGGGFDYIYRRLGKNPDDPVMILADREDPGSPKTLAEPALVRLQLNEDWSAMVAFEFDSAEAGLDFMAGFAGADLDWLPKNIAGGGLLEAAKQALESITPWLNYAQQEAHFTLKAAIAKADKGGQ